MSENKEQRVEAADVLTQLRRSLMGYTYAEFNLLRVVKGELTGSGAKDVIKDGRAAIDRLTI